MIFASVPSGEAIAPILPPTASPFPLSQLHQRTHYQNGVMRGGLRYSRRSMPAKFGQGPAIRGGYGDVTLLSSVQQFNHTAGNGQANPVMYVPEGVRMQSVSITTTIAILTLNAHISMVVAGAALSYCQYAGCSSGHGQHCNSEFDLDWSECWCCLLVLRCDGDVVVCSQFYIYSNFSSSHSTCRSTEAWSPLTMLPVEFRHKDNLCRSHRWSVGPHQMVTWVKNPYLCWLYY